MRTIGPYQIIRKLGQSVLGEVFLVTLPTTDGKPGGTPFVVRRFDPVLFPTPKAVAQLRADTEILKRAIHPNVARLIDTGQDGAGPYHVTEWLPGVTLAELIRHAREVGAPLPLAAVVRIIAQIGMGLEVIHALCDDHGMPAGLIHLDVTPANVLVGFDGLPRLLDTGTSLVPYIEAPRAYNTLKRGFQHMSPEQLREGAVDRRSDVYALGAVLYEAVTLEPAFPQEDPREILHAMTQNLFVMPDQLRSGLPMGITQVILRTLRAEPGERIQSALELSHALLDAEPQIPVEPEAEDLGRWLGLLYPERAAQAQAGVAALLLDTPGARGSATDVPTMGIGVTPTPTPQPQGVHTPRPGGPASGIVRRPSVAIGAGASLTAEAARAALEAPGSSAVPGTGTPSAHAPGTPATAPTGSPDTKPAVVKVEDLRSTAIITAIAAVLGLIVILWSWSARNSRYADDFPPREFQPKTGRLYLLTVPEDAEVIVNGQKRGSQTPFIDREVPLGQRIVIEVKKPGYLSSTHEFTLSTRDHLEGVVINLKPDNRREP